MSQSDWMYWLEPDAYKVVHRAGDPDAVQRINDLFEEEARHQERMYRRNESQRVERASGMTPTEATTASKWPRGG